MGLQMAGKSLINVASIAKMRKWRASGEIARRSRPISQHRKLSKLLLRLLGGLRAIGKVGKRRMPSKMAPCRILITSSGTGLASGGRRNAHSMAVAALVVVVLGRRVEVMTALQRAMHPRMTRRSEALIH